MNRALQLLLGPELYWVGVYLASRILAGGVPRRTPVGNTILEWSCWLLPALAVAGSFALFYWAMPPTGSRSWLTTRLLIATFIGLNAALFVIIDAIDYGDTRNSGVLGFWFVGLFVGGLVWLASYVAIVIAARGRAV